MENWKGKVGNVFQKVNSAGRNFLSTLRPEVEHSKDLGKRINLHYNALQYFGERFEDDEDELEIDPCVDCDREFGIIAIEDDSGNFGSDDLERRNDREEIRRKLAMDSDNEDYVAEKLVLNQESNPIDRLKGGSNLQICFMNEAAKDPEVIPDAEPTVELAKPNVEKVRKPLPKILMTNLLFPSSLQRSPGSSKMQNNNTQSQVVKRQRPTFFFNRPRSWHAAKVEEKPDPEEDLFTRHHRLQAEAREALTQAKDMARMQMEIERQKKKKSPIADIVGISFPDGQNSLSRHALLDMNVAQLQVIVNDLHSQIETLNENLVKFLLERDDLHMEQDSMLVDIEDLTRYLGLKGSSAVSHSMDSKLPFNVEVSSSNNKKSLI